MKQVYRVSVQRQTNIWVQSWLVFSLHPRLRGGGCGEIVKGGTVLKSGQEIRLAREEIPSGGNSGGGNPSGHQSVRPLRMFMSCCHFQTATGTYQNKVLYKYFSWQT
jgi:hypothetical protein